MGDAEAIIIEKEQHNPMLPVSSSVQHTVGIIAIENIAPIRLFKTVEICYTQDMDHRSEQAFISRTRIAETNIRRHSDPNDPGTKNGSANAGGGPEEWRSQ